MHWEPSLRNYVVCTLVAVGYLSRGIFNGINKKTQFHVTNHTTMSSKIPQATMTLKQVL
jgi:hypothetical protein